MTPEDVDMAMRLLGTYWPHQSTSFTKELLEAWQREFALLDFDRVDKTLATMVHNGQKFRPDIAEFTEAYRSHARPEPFKAKGTPARDGSKMPMQEFRRLCTEGNTRRIQRQNAHERSPQ